MRRGGSRPDDLDVCLNLRECPADVSVATVIEALADFAAARPELEVSHVRPQSILSDTSKDKNVDTAKVCVKVGDPLELVEVDVMPTIGEETYDEVDRVPTRDTRGTPEQAAPPRPED